MNREYNCKVSSKNSKRLLKNLQNTTGDYFFLPHPVYTHLPHKLKCTQRMEKTLLTSLITEFKLTCKVCTQRRCFTFVAGNKAATFWKVSYCSHCYWAFVS